MTGVLFALASGACFGAMNVTMRRAVARVPDVDAGSAAISLVAFALVAAAAVALRAGFDATDLWPFLAIGAVVPGITQLLVIHAVRAAGASRAGILFGMAPLFSALFALVAFGEPFRWPLVVGTLLVVGGGVLLAVEGERPAGYRAYGAVLAVTVAVAFGLRDNVARAITEDVDAEPLAQVAAVMLGSMIVLLANLGRQRAPAARFGAALPAFASSGLVTALAQGTLFEALDRAPVTVVAPLVGTGVLWTVVFAAIFLGRSELVGRRIILVALLVAAGGALVGATR